MSFLITRPTADRTFGRSEIRTRAVAALGAGSLFGLAACSLAVVLIAAERPELPGAGVEAGILSSVDGRTAAGAVARADQRGRSLSWLMSGLLIAMFALYLAATRAAPRLPARWSIAAVLAVHAVFLLAPPLSYTDVFNYINYGRMGVLHHLNPYVVLPVAKPHADPAYALSNWHHLLTPYGPLFTLLSYALVPLGVTVSFWALKSLIGMASLAMLALVWRCAELLGRSPVAAVVLVGCNPIVLVWGLAPTTTTR